LVAAKSFSPNDVEATVEVGGEDEFKGSSGGSTDGESGNVDLGSDFVGVVEDVDILSDNSGLKQFWLDAGVGVGRDVKSGSVSTGDLSLVNGELWDVVGEGIVVTVEGDNVSVGEEELCRTDEGEGGVGAGGEGLTV